MRIWIKNTLNSESLYISVNNNTNFKKIDILSIYNIWDRISLKTISRYYPFNVLEFSASDRRESERQH
jgi:hypothetical protein